jgi:amino acid transporter
VKKLIATPAAVIATLVVLATPAAAEATANTGTVGPADEPTWVIPFVIAFAVICAVVAILGTRRTDR